MAFHPLHHVVQLFAQAQALKLAERRQRLPEHGRVIAHKRAVVDAETGFGVVVTVLAVPCYRGIVARAAPFLHVRQILGQLPLAQFLPGGQIKLLGYGGQQQRGSPSFLPPLQAFINQAVAQAGVFGDGHGAWKKIGSANVRYICEPAIARVALLKATFQRHFIAAQRSHQHQNFRLELADLPASDIRRILRQVVRWSEG